MKRNFNRMVEREIAWRWLRKDVISTVAKFSGLPPLVVASELSKRIDGGRKMIFVDGEHVGYG